MPQGGTEKMLTEKANYLSAHFGYDVTVIACTQRSGQCNAFPLSPAVRQLNLGVAYYRQYRYGYPRRLWIKRETDKALKAAIADTIRQTDPDVVVCTVGFRADLVSAVGCRGKIVAECHEPRMFVMADLDGRRSWPSRLYMALYQRAKYFRTIERNVDAVVTLTEGDKRLWGRARRVEVIPNFSTMPVARRSDCSRKRIIAVGRLSAEKGYDRLVEVWRRLSSHYPEWSLDVFGDGRLRDELAATIQDMPLGNMSLRPATSRISEEYANSSIFVMTSRHEGFGLVLLEAMKHGLPSVAFDCPFGPGSIISDGVCGYLAADGDIPLFAEKLRLLMESEDIRRTFSAAAIARANDFSPDAVMKQWKQLFENLTETIQNLTGT